MRRLLPATWIVRRGLSTNAIRTNFLRHYEAKGFKVTKSSSLIPHGDSSLLFTNAGMVQFKQFFIDPSLAKEKLAVSVQKCVRAGGKHNDLDQVGHTNRHHTFFEMLGTFSFGQLSKSEAITLSLEFLTSAPISLKPEELYITVLQQDHESFNIWNDLGFDGRISLKTEQDNFWSMGDQGPCGPCTEIFVKRGDELTEIWNIVFMEFNKSPNGLMQPLPKLCVDTGMGLERLAAYLQNVTNTFEIDIFRSMNQNLLQVLPNPNNSWDKVDANILLDHFRSSSFLLVDGVIPSNLGRGYVLRKIIRKAICHGRRLGFSKPCLAQLYPGLLQAYPWEVYPELSERKNQTLELLTQEEEIFYKALERGNDLLAQTLNDPSLAQNKILPAQVVFKLHDTHGFPIEFTEIIMKEKGWKLDLTGFDKLREEQQYTSRNSWKGSKNGQFQVLPEDLAQKASIITNEWIRLGYCSKFIGYDVWSKEHPAKIIAASKLSDEKDQSLLIVNKCPLYPGGGGQIADLGYLTLKSGGDLLQLQNIFAISETAIVLHVQHSPEINIKADDEVLVKVDKDKRSRIQVHHTATHLLNASLRHTLQKEINQAGSLVEAERLRFDFTHGKPLSKLELEKVEAWINNICKKELELETSVMPLKEAIEAGAVAIFSEKYGDQVRVVKIGDESLELCGGTHVDHTGQVYPFKILTESAVAAGTRRIEAVAGKAAIEWLLKQQAILDELCQGLNHPSVEKLPALVKALEEKSKLNLKHSNDLLEWLAKQDSLDHEVLVGEIRKIPVSVHLLKPLPKSSSSASLAKLRLNSLLLNSVNNQEQVLVVINGVEIAVGTCSSQVDVRMVLKTILEKLGGQGGGKANFAQGRLNSSLNDAEKIIDLIKLV